MKSRQPEEDIAIVLAHPTEHNILGILRKQYRSVDMHILTDATIIDIANGGQERLTRRIVDSVTQLPEGHYHLVETGHRLASTLAYEALCQRFDKVSLLIYDSRRKRYLAVADLPKQVRDRLVEREENGKYTNGGKP